MILFIFRYIFYPLLFFCVMFCCCCMKYVENYLKASLEKSCSYWDEWVNECILYKWQKTEERTTRFICKIYATICWCCQYQALRYYSYSCINSRLYFEIVPPFFSCLFCGVKGEKIVFSIKGCKLDVVVRQQGYFK